MLQRSISADECRMNPQSDRSTNSSARQPTRTSEELRALAAWYRDYAELAGSPVIWDYRFSTAEDLERLAANLDSKETAPLAV